MEAAKTMETGPFEYLHKFGKLYPIHTSCIATSNRKMVSGYFLVRDLLLDSYSISWQ
jgi:hypothetical protein